VNIRRRSRAIRGTLVLVMRSRYRVRRRSVSSGGRTRFRLGRRLSSRAISYTNRRSVGYMLLSDISAGAVPDDEGVMRISMKTSRLGAFLLAAGSRRLAISAFAYFDSVLDVLTTVCGRRLCGGLLNHDLGCRAIVAAAAAIIADRRLAAGLLGQVARLARAGPHHMDTHLVRYTFAERPRHRIRRGRRASVRSIMIA
jgi:hypothetical protein